MIHTATYGYTGTLTSELVAFARRQLVNATLYKGDQRRREERRPMMLPVLAVPVDEENQPIGVPFEVITRDVAATSIGLIHAEHMPHDRIAIHMTLANTDVDLVVELKWRGPMGPFYGSGGAFLERLDRFPCDPECLVPRDPECLVPRDPECLVPCEPECLVPCEPECLVPCDLECLVPCDTECLDRQGE